jgi:hypothetical protein
MRQSPCAGRLRRTDHFGMTIVIGHHDLGRNLSGLRTAARPFRAGTPSRMRSTLNWPSLRPPSMASLTPRGLAAFHIRLSALAGLPMVSSVWARISSPVMPEAIAAPMIAPIEDPAIATGLIPIESRVSMTWIWAIPRAPPPPKATRPSARKNATRSRVRRALYQSFLNPVSVVPSAITAFSGKPEAS